MKNPLSKTEYKAALEHFGMTQAQAGWLFNGKSKISGRRWAVEGAPFHIALLFALMHKYRISPKKIEEIGAKWRRGK